MLAFLLFFDSTFSVAGTVCSEYTANFEMKTLHVDFLLHVHIYEKKKGIVRRNQIPKLYTYAIFTLPLKTKPYSHSRIPLISVYVIQFHPPHVQFCHKHLQPPLPPSIPPGPPWAVVTLTCPNGPRAGLTNFPPIPLASSCTFFSLGTMCSLASKP